MTSSQAQQLITITGVGFIGVIGLLMGIFRCLTQIRDNKKKRHLWQGC